MSSYRSYSGRPSSSYTSYSSPVTRHYVGVDRPEREVTRSESSYSKTYSSSSSGGPGGATRSYTSESKSVSGGRPGSGYSYTIESNSGGGPGSHFSSVSYRSPYGNNYRSFSSR